MKVSELKTAIANLPDYASLQIRLGDEFYGFAINTNSGRDFTKDLVELIPDVPEGMAAGVIPSDWETFLKNVPLEELARAISSKGFNVSLSN